MCLYYISLSCVLTNIQIITTHNTNDHHHVSDGYIVLTAFSAAGNHLWYLSGAMYSAVFSLPNVAYTCVHNDCNVAHVLKNTMVIYISGM